MPDLAGGDGAWGSQVVGGGDDLGGGMGGGPLGFVPLGSSVVLYVGSLRCGWRGRGVAQRPVVWQGVGVGVWGLGCGYPGGVG